MPDQVAVAATDSDPKRGILNRLEEEQKRARALVPKPQPTTPIMEMIVRVEIACGHPLDDGEQAIVRQANALGVPLAKILEMVAEPIPEAPEPEDHAYLPAGGFVSEIRPGQFD